MPKGKRVLRQLDYISKGDTLEFIRAVLYKNNWLAATGGKRVEVLLTGSEYTAIAFKKPVRNIHGQPARMWPSKGFKYCLLVSNTVLLDNCKKV